MQAIGSITNKLGGNIIKKSRNDYQRIFANYKFLEKKYKQQSLISTEKWLVENKLLVLETAQGVKKTLTNHFISRLPTLKTHPHQIRIFTALSDLITHSDYRLNYNRIWKFVESYQLETKLTIAELWAIPLVLKTLLINSICVSLSDEKIIKDIVLGLRNLQKIDWGVFVEETSVVEKIFKHDPTGTYPLMDFRTRDIYRHVVEEIHFQTRRSQEEIAQWVVTESKKTGGHIGYYLLGQGRGLIDKFFLPQRKISESLALFLRRRPIKVYLGLIWSLALLFLLGSQSRVFWLAIFPSLWLASLAAHLIIVKLYPPTFLPKMEPTLPVDEKDRTMVLTPTLLLPDVKNCQKVLSTLEENFLANKDENIFFGLTLAWPETKNNDGKPTSEETSALELVKEGLRDLNKKYPCFHKRFHLFFRDRKWSVDEQSWVEWERKRGKIMEFVRLLRGAGNTTYSYSSASPEFLSTIKYVITVDDDVTLPRDSAKKLVATIIHPLNKAVMNKERKVISGYGIIQPRISTQVPLGRKTLADYLFAGNSGWDSYSNATSNVYQDIFRESFFMGRGIFDVDVFGKALAGRFPENTLLSHDHLEGFYCRTGFASDIQLFETYPSTYSAYYRRLHRWVRGDWQRIFWIFPWVGNLASFQRWKLIEDMIQNLSLVATVLLAILFFEWRLFFIVFLICPVISLIESFPARNGLLLKEDLKTFFVRALFNTIFSFHQSLVVSHAIITALVRLFITKRKRLEWATFSQSNLFEESQIKSPFPKEEEDNLRIIARKTWRYFDDLVTAKTHYLPPDHFQQTTLSPVSTRTSATNIGMYLTSLVAAFDLGFISKQDFLERCQKTLATLSKLDLLHGHFFNWYDITTLKVLPPSYVSTVDSGNLACALLVLSEALLELECQKLSLLAEKLAMNMDFSFLYNSKRNLFRIGYNLFNKTFDRGHYDLFASESRMASFFAIAKYDAPLKHWSALAKPMTTYHHQAAILSWGGSVFEYLFPNLFLPNYPNTLLWESYQTVVSGHIDYARKNHIPWGISESSYGLMNKDGHYRYKLHGVPDFGLKQFPYKDLVVSPYAVFLSLEIFPKAAYQNILRLEKEGLAGIYGLYESVDYTNYESGPIPDRVIKTFLCHHQGIILTSITNLLNNFSIRNRLSKVKVIKAHLTLLQEPIPRDISFSVSQVLPGTDVSEEQAQIPETIIKPSHPTPRFNWLSNGRYSVFLDALGKGYSQYQHFKLTGPVTLTLTEGIVVETEVIVPEESDVEIRYLTIKNNSSKKRLVELTSCAEVVLDDPVSAQTHPVFSKMRVESEYFSNSQTLVFRRLSAPSVNVPIFASKVLTFNNWVKKRYETDRQKVLGRTGPIFSGSTGFTLDPVACWNISTTLDPHASQKYCFLSAAGYSQEAVFASLARYSGAETIKKVITNKNNIELAVCLIHGRELSKEKYTYSFVKKLTRPNLSINWALPSLVILVRANVKAHLLQHCFNLCYSVSNSGLRFNVIFVIKDGDNYYQTTYNTVLELSNQFETKAVNDNLASPNITLLRVNNLTSREIKFLTATASLVVDSKKGDVNKQINIEFNKL